MSSSQKGSFSALRGSCLILQHRPIIRLDLKYLAVFDKFRILEARKRSELCEKLANDVSSGLFKSDSSASASLCQSDPQQNSPSLSHDKTQWRGMPNQAQVRGLFTACDSTLLWVEGPMQLRKAGQKEGVALHLSEECPTLKCCAKDATSTCLESTFTRTSVNASLLW